MLWDQIYDHLDVMLCVKVQILIDEIFLKCQYGHLQSCFFLLLLNLVTRNPNLGIPALEDGLLANWLIFDDF